MIKSVGNAVQTEPPPKVDLVYLALILFVVAHIGFRAISRVFGVFAETLGIKRAPCPQTIINWVMRLSLIRIHSASDMMGFSQSGGQFSNGSIWIIDTSIGLGTGKILAVLALNINHHQLNPGAPCLQKVRCIAVSVAHSWTGDTIADFLLRVMAVMGCPSAYIKDGGCDLRKAHRLVGEQGKESSAIDDISHMVATILKHEYQDHPTMATFLSACGKASSKFKQTILACLAPPKVQTKARFMNVHRLFTWADQLLRILTGGRALIGSTMARLQQSLGQIPECRLFIKRFHDDASALLMCEKILKIKGLSHETHLQCKPILETIPSPGVRRDFSDYLHAQLATATTLGLANTGMPISSDAIESLFGLSKHHGTGEIMDANRIALRLPALCGIPTKQEAQQVIEMTIAEQNKYTNDLSSLTKQRLEMFSGRGSIEKLDHDHTHNRIELIPESKKRSNDENIFDISSSSRERYGPQSVHQEWPQHLAIAAS